MKKRQYLLYLGDNLKVLKAKQKKWKGKFRCIFTDPPYFLSTYRSKEYEVTTAFRKKGIKLFKGQWDMIPDEYMDKPYDYVIDHSIKWLKLCKKLFTEDGTIFVCGMGQFNLFGVIYALMKLKYWILNNIYIYKPNAPPNIRGVRFAGSVEEMIWAKQSEKNPYLFNYKKMKKYNKGKQMRNLWKITHIPPKFPRSVKKKDIHRTQKPEEQVKRAILATTKKGDWILDPFLGSGTTMKVAKKLGRNCIGIEANPEYLPIIKAKVGWNEESLWEDRTYKIIKKYR